MISRVVLFVAPMMLLLSGCVSIPEIQVPTVGEYRPTLPDRLKSIRAKPEGECPVWIYRTKTYYHSLTLQQPYFFVDGYKIDPLRVGDTQCLNLPEGKYEIEMMEPVMFVPTLKSGTVTVDVKPGQTLFVRYSKEMGGMIPTGVGVHVVSQTSLTLVDKQAWESRK